jgi:hypothetical protein
MSRFGYRGSHTHVGTGGADSPERIARMA